MEDRLGGLTYRDRLRIICHLPANNSAQSAAIGRFFDYLRNPGTGIDGYTSSSPHPALFHGYWWKEDDKQWIRDSIVVCMIDYLLEEKKPATDVIANLKRKIDRLYREAAPDEREKQDVIWILSHQVIEYANPPTSDAKPK